MRFKQFIVENFNPSNFGSKRDLSEHFISHFDIKDLVYEAIIHVSNEVEKIVQEIENSKEHSIETLNKILTKYNIAFFEDNEKEISGYNYKYKSLYLIAIKYNKEYLENIINKNSYMYWHMIARRIGWIIGHEMIHNDQKSFIKDDSIIKKLSTFGLNLEKKEEKIKYLSSKHEIMAFAYTIWKELEYEFSNKNSILKILKTPKEIIQSSDVAKDYFELFDYDFSHPVLKRLLKYLYEYVQNMRHF